MDNPLHKHNVGLSNERVHDGDEVHLYITCAIPYNDLKGFIRKYMMQLISFIQRESGLTGYAPYYFMPMHDRRIKVVMRRKEC